MGSVTGQVTMDGEPLPSALVTFTPVDGGVAGTGITDAEGRYQLISLDRKGAVPGKHKVSVTTVSQAEAATGLPEGTSADSDAYEQYVTGGSAAAYEAATVAEQIPERYNTESELVEEVTPGNNVINLELESGG